MTWEAFDGVADAVTAFRDDGRYVYANAEAARLFAVSREEMLARRVGDFTPPEGRGALEGFLQALRRGDDVSCDYEIVADDGRARTLQARASANYSPGVHLAVFREAIPARSAPTLELFRAAFEDAPDPIMLADDDRRYLAMNRAARELLGINKQTVPERAIDSVTPEDSRAELPRIWQTFLEHGELEGQYPFLVPGGVRVMRFNARANILPGRHLAILHPVEQPAAADTEIQVQRTGRPRLSRREREVLTHLARGFDGTGIAAIMGLSPETVRTHAANATKKLGARTRGQAIARALLTHEIEVEGAPETSG